MKKNVYLIQNSNLSFEMDISKIYSPKKYSLFLIINAFGLKRPEERHQNHYFENIWETEIFNLGYLKELISNNQQTNKKPFQIVTNAEEAIILCGQLRVLFNIDINGFDRFKNKLLMKELLNKHGLLIPKYLSFDKVRYITNPSKYIQFILNTLNLPLITKPIDSMGCIGIKKIYSVKELSIWCSTAILTREQYEIDEFIEGKVYNCDSFIKNNKIQFTQISECSNSCYDFICGLTKGTIAIPHHHYPYNLLCDYTIKIHDAIKPPLGGVTHLEVILTCDEKVYFIEIGYRSPGILIPAMYKKFLNVDTVESHILLQIDDDFNFKRDIGCYSAWVAFPTNNGRLKRRNIPTINSHYKLEWIISVGSLMAEPTCGRDYAGRVLLWNDDYAQLRKDFYYLNSYQFYEIEAV